MLQDCFDSDNNYGKDEGDDQYHDDQYEGDDQYDDDDKGDDNGDQSSMMTMVMYWPAAESWEPFLKGLRASKVC